MKFTPDYGVVYHGQLYRGGATFDIDDRDAEEMSRHGTVDGAPPEDVTLPREDADVPRRGRPRKNEV